MPRALVDQGDRPDPLLPVEEVPGLFLHQAGGEDHVGDFRHGIGAGGDVHHERLPQRMQGGVSLRHVVGVDARDEEGLQVALAGRGELFGGAQPGLGRKRLGSPGRSHIDPGLSGGDGTPAGQQPGKAARCDGSHIAGAARHPGQARPAENSLGGDRREQARLAGGPLTHEDDGALLQLHGLQGLRLRTGGDGD